MRSAYLALVFSTVLSAGAVYQATFNINTGRWNSYDSQGVNKTYSYTTSSLTNVNWFGDSQSSGNGATVLKGSLSLNGNADPNTYFRTISFDGLTVTDENPAGTLAVGWEDPFSKAGTDGQSFQHQLTYSIDGLRSATSAETWVSLSATVYTCSFGTTPPGGICSALNTSTVKWGPNDSIPSTTLLQVAAPYNTNYYLYQELRLWVAVPDYIHHLPDTNAPPDPFDPTNNINLYNSPYTFNASMDFANTVTVTQHRLLDLSNNLLANQTLGAHDSFQSVGNEVPEPSSASLMTLVAAAAAAIRFRRQSN